MSGRAGLRSNLGNENDDGGGDGAAVRGGSEWECKRGGGARTLKIAMETRGAATQTSAGWKGNNGGNVGGGGIEAKNGRADRRARDLTHYAECCVIRRSRGPARTVSQIVGRGSRGRAGVGGIRIDPTVHGHAAGRRDGTGRGTGRDDATPRRQLTRQPWIILFYFRTRGATVERKKRSRKPTRRFKRTRLGSVSNLQFRGSSVVSPFHL